MIVNILLNIYIYIIKIKRIFVHATIWSFIWDSKPFGDGLVHEYSWLRVFELLITFLTSSW